MADPFRTYGLSCPSGGTFYVCQGNRTEFLGCCTTNPCADGSGRCPQENLQPSSFSADTYADLPRQDCDDARSINIWFTCKFNKPPFLGCCASNPCGQGSCPKADLRPAKLSGDVDFRQPFLAATPSPSSSSAGPSSTTSSGAAGTGTLSTQVQVATSNGGLSTGAIVGIAVSIAVIVIAFLAFAAFRWGRKGSARKRDKRVPPAIDAPGYDGDTSFSGGRGQYSPYRDSSFTGHTAVGSPSFYQNSPMAASFYKPAGQAYHHSPTPEAYPLHGGNPHRVSAMTDSTVPGTLSPRQPTGFEYHSRHHSAQGALAVHEMEGGGLAQASELAGDPGAYVPTYNAPAAEENPLASAYGSPFQSPRYPPAAAADVPHEQTTFLPREAGSSGRQPSPGLYDGEFQHAGWDADGAGYDTGASNLDGRGRR